MVVRSGVAAEFAFAKYIAPPMTALPTKATLTITTVRPFAAGGGMDASGRAGLSNAGGLGNGAATVGAGSTASGKRAAETSAFISCVVW